MASERSDGMRRREPLPLGAAPGGAAEAGPCVKARAIRHPCPRPARRPDLERSVYRKNPDVPAHAEAWPGMGASATRQAPVPKSR